LLRPDTLHLFQAGFAVGLHPLARGVFLFEAYLDKSVAVPRTKRGSVLLQLNAISVHHVAASSRHVGPGADKDVG
jgi:hypothetical protein